MKAVSVLSTTGGTELAAAGNRDFINIYNNGSETVFLKYDGDTANALTVDNGWPLLAGGTFFSSNDGSRNTFRHRVLAIAAVGPVDVRVQGD